MSETQLIEKKLAFIETCIQELKTLGRPEDVQTDIREQRFEAYTLQIAIQAALDTAALIVSARRLGEPRNNRHLFEILVQHGWLPTGLAPVLHNMVGFRNILVHGYEAVNPAVVEEVTRDHLDDLLAFVSSVRERLASE